MPAFESQTLNGLAGADHVFAPDHVTPQGTATWLVPGTAPIGDEKMTFLVTRNPATGTIKVKMQLVIPKVEDLGTDVPKPVVVRQILANLEIFSSYGAPEEDRYEVLDLLRSMLSYTDNPAISTAIVKSQPFN